MLSRLFHLLLVGGLAQVALSRPRLHRRDSQCGNLTLPALPSLPDVKVLAVQGFEVHNLSYPLVPNSNSTVLTGLNYCNITVTLTHGQAKDFEYVTVLLPLSGWNERLQAVGGGGLSAGVNVALIMPALASGYAAAGTDGGLSLNNTVNAATGPWALNPDGTLNYELMENYVHRAAHDSAVVGKAVTRAFYGKRAKYSYWNGCSNGGRQGHVVAGRYPDDFDGILAYSPALSTVNILAGAFWPLVVMKDLGAPRQCVFQAFQKDIVAACDPLDGAKDGLISDQKKCVYDAQRLVGANITCPDGDLIITKAHATIITKLLEGPRALNGTQFSPGIPPGASFSGLSNTVTVNGTTTPVPWGTMSFLAKNFLFKNPNYDLTNISHVDFENAINVGFAEFNGFISNIKTDLSDFRDSGGKLLSWHGMADEIVPSQSAVIYRDQVVAEMGSNEDVDEFYRLFLAPGVGHCSGGTGPVPVDPLKVLVDWVEKDIVPDTIPAAKNISAEVTLTRNLCRYPLLLKYDGKGDVNAASSFSCVSKIS